MNAMKRITSLLLASLLTVGAPAALAEDTPVQPELVARVKDVIEADGYQFKDLNDNGELDPYEDWRLTPEERADNLLSMMDASQKAAQMVHLTLVTKKDSWFTKDNVGFALVYESVFDVEEADEEDEEEEADEDAVQVTGSAMNATVKTNEIQELSESSALGIPVLFSMDTEAGAAFVKDATFLPDEINLGAANDEALTARYYEAMREELKAIGVRMALSPDADLITDPRWGRNQECYSEDTDVVQRLIKVAVQTLQNGSGLTADSVLATVKHFPGSGAQTDGVDGTPLTIAADSLELHLAGFRAAIDAGVAAVMPYGYSTVPYLGGDAVENYADQSAAVMTNLLRGQMGYDGIIQTDWGLNFVGATNAGADILGGAGVRSTRQLVDEVDEARLTDACRRILIAKFQMGLFENPYVDETRAEKIVGSDEHKAVAKEAAAKSFTLVKYENAASLAGQKFFVAGELADNVRCLNSGWTAKEPVELAGESILAALQAKAGAGNVTYIETAADVPQDLTGVTAVVVVGEKSGTHEPAWGTATLEFPEEQTALVEALDKAGANVVAVVVMNRAYVLTPIVEAADSVLLVYRPGVTCGAQAVADCLLGETAITGRLPFQIPASMDQVLAQREDLPKEMLCFSDLSEAEDAALLSERRARHIDSDLLYVLFTSGSTGTPKGVSVTHRGVIDLVEWACDALRLPEGVRFGSQAPFYFDNSVLDIYCAMRMRGSLFLIPRGDFLFPKRLLQSLREARVDTIFWVPSALSALACSGVLESGCLPSMQRVFFCGETMPCATLNEWKRALPEADYVNMYGPTEITDVCAWYRVDRAFDDTDSLPIGFPCANTRILLLDGEICIAGTCLAAGYYNAPEKTAAAFVQNPLRPQIPELIYRTGDLGAYNDRGELMFLGRRDSQIKRSGYRIELGEIECALQSVPGVELACCYYDAEKEKIVAAYTGPADEKALKAALKAALPRYMMPDRYIRRDSLPRTGSGKLDRLALKQEADSERHLS